MSVPTATDPSTAPFPRINDVPLPAQRSSSASAPATAAIPVASPPPPVRPLPASLSPRRSRPLHRARTALSSALPSRLRLSGPLLAAWSYIAARSVTLRLILVTAAAAGAAWTVSTHVGLYSTALASVAACLTVQASVPSSVKEAALRLTATIAGMSVAVIAATTFGTSAWTAVFVVASSLALGRLIGMGPEGSLQVPATSLFIFVLGSDLQAGLVLDRMGATAVGVIVGVAASTLSHPSSPFERARDQVESLASEIADLLSRIAAALPGCTPGAAADLHAEAAALDARLVSASRDVDAAVAAARFNRSRPISLMRLLASLDALSSSCNQVQALAATLVSAAASSSQADLPAELAEVLDAAGEAFSAHADAVASKSGYEFAEVQSRLDEVQVLRERSVESLRDLDDTQAWLFSGAILTELDRMVDDLEAAHEPTEPAAPKPSHRLPWQRRQR